MAAAGGSSSSPSDFNSNNLHLLKQIRSHEVAIAELSHLSSSRAIYQKNGNLFFRTTVPKATAFEQSQLDTAKSKLQKPDSHA